jgi:hypothetical protein
MNKELLNKISLNVLVALIVAILTWTGSTFYNNQLQNKDVTNAILNMASKFEETNKKFTSIEIVIDKFGAKLESDQKINDTKLNLLDKQLALIELRIKNLEDKQALAK